MMTYHPAKVDATLLDAATGWIIENVGSESICLSSCDSYPKYLWWIQKKHTFWGTQYGTQHDYYPTSRHQDSTCTHLDLSQEEIGLALLIIKERLGIK